MLAEGTFHESPVEDVATRAGVSRATLYQHFNSRLELVDGICDTMGTNPALLKLRETVALEDPDAAFDQTLALAVEFWSTENAVLEQLYGVVAADVAAQEFVTRQRGDRSSEIGRLAHTLHRAGRLRAGLGEKRAHALLMLLTSYGTYRELRSEGLADRELVRTLQQSARLMLFDTDA
jgi:AcrR family transcriptional regulator